MIAAALSACISPYHSQRGSSLLEVLVSLAVCAIIGFAVSQSTTVGYKLLGTSRERALTQQVVVTTIEELSLRDPKLLEEGTCSQAMPRNQTTITREVSITSNPDDSKTIEVSAYIADHDGSRRSSSSLSARLSSWRNS